MNSIFLATILNIEPLNVLDESVVVAYTFHPGLNEVFGYPEKGEGKVLVFFGVLLAFEVTVWDKKYEKGCAGGIP